MTLRILRCITVLLVSHLLTGALGFTSELPSQPAPANLPSQEVTIKSRQQEKQGDLFQLDGDVEVQFQSYVLRASHATYNSATGDVEATGRVVFDGGPHDAHLTASRAKYNVRAESGTFYEVVGTLGAVVRGQSVVLTTNNPFMLTGREVRKEHNRYIVLHGTITSCTEAKPAWTFNAEKIDVVAGDDAKLYHSTFRLLQLPVFYFPYAQAPATAMSRTSGFLLPIIGQSSIKGVIVGDSVYWAINRSSDLTVGTEYFSSRGWSQTAEFRARPSEKSSIEAHYFGVLDRGTPVTQTINGQTTTFIQDQGGQDVRLVADTTHDMWRGSANIEYLSSFLFRQAFSESYSQAVNSEVRSVAYLSRNADGFSLNVNASRYQNFYQNQATDAYSDQIKILHLPMAETNALERNLFSSPFRWSADASLGGMQRSEPGFVTANLVGRLDLHPRLALPVEWKGWRLRPEVAVRDTLYSQQDRPSASAPLGVAGGNSLNRGDVEASVELRPPALERVFDVPFFGHRIKHVIEPVLTYRYVGGVENFQNIIRFDENDIQSNTREFEYDFIQRVYGRRHTLRHDPACEAEPNAPAPSAAPKPEKAVPYYVPGVSAVRPRCEDEGSATRELMSWEIKQKYYFDQTFGGALVTGRRNVFLNTVDLTGIAFLDAPRAWSPLISQLRIQTSANTDVQWQLDYDFVRGRVNSSATFIEYRVGEYFFGGSHAYFHEPANLVTETISNEPLVFNQFRYLVGYGHPNKRGFSGGFSGGYDQSRDFAQYSAAQASYNWDCCGTSFEFRKIAVPGVRNENEYRFAFSLSNIATFGNMRRQQKLY